MSQETTIKIGGVPYRLSKFDAVLHQEFLDWSKSVLPDPVAEVLPYLDKLPADLRKDTLDNAFQAKRLRGSLSDPDVTALLQRPEGYRKLFSLLFRKHHPALTEAEIVDLVAQAAEEHGEQVFQEVFGKAAGRFPAE